MSKSLSSAPETRPSELANARARYTQKIADVLSKTGSVILSEDELLIRAATVIAETVTFMERGYK